MNKSFQLFDIYHKYLLKIARILLAFYFFSFPSHCLAENSIIIRFIDVGYGDSILFELTDGQRVLVDAGSLQSSDRLIEYLSSLNIDKFEKAILTHPHENHFGGFIPLVDKWPIGKFYVNGDAKRAEKGYEDLVNKIIENEISVDIIKEGNEILLVKGETRL